MASPDPRSLRSAPAGSVVLLLEDGVADVPASGEDAPRARDRNRDDEGRPAAQVRTAPRRRVLTLLAAIATVALIAGTAAALGRPSAPAASPYSWDNLPGPLRDRPSKRWSIALDGARLVDAATEEGVVYAGLDDGGIARVVALDAKTGASRWQVNLPAGLRLQRVVADGDLVVVVSLAEGTLRFAVLDRSNGISRWTATVGGRFAAVVPGADRLLLLTGNQPQLFDRAAGYDRRTGEQVWSRNAPVGVVDGNRLAVLAQHDVVTLDVDTGEVRQRWREVTPDDTGRTPVVVGDHVAVMSDSGVRIGMLGRRVPAQPVAPGVGSPYLVLPIGDDQVTVVSPQGAAGVDVAGQQVRWARDVSARAVARADGHLVLLTAYGGSGSTLTVVDAATGREEGFRRFDDLARRSLSVRSGYLADGAAYLVDDGGGIEGVELPSLGTMWELDSTTLGGAARDVRATDAGLLVANDADSLVLLR